MSLSSDVENSVVDALVNYTRFKRAVLAAFADFLLTQDAQSVTGSSVLLKRLMEIRAEYIKPLIESLHKAANTSMEGAFTTLFKRGDESPFTEEQLKTMDQFVESMIDRAQQNISYQMTSDANQMVTLFKRYLLKVYLAEKQGANRTNALIAERHYLLRHMDLYRRDALGRKRDSEAFVFTELRFAIYRSFNIIIVFMLSAIGETKARVLAPGSSADGRVFNLDDFESLENELFHPNAQALVVPLDSNP